MSQRYRFCWETFYMAKKFSFDFQLNSPLTPVIALFASENFVQDAVAQSKAAAWDVTIKQPLPNLEIEISRTYREDWPSMVKKFIGDDLVVNETRYWEPDGEHQYFGTITARVVGQPITVDGKFTATEESGVTVVTVNGVVNCAIPFFGGQVESFAIDILQSGFEAEAELAQSRLS
jgi:hypothetical protein